LFTHGMIDARSLSLYLIRAVGGFALAKFITRKQLRILCYHGLAVGDEYEVAPHMFMRGATFDRRMAILKKRGLPVISLDEAIQRFESQKISRGETVITFDDGWASNLSIGWPILKKYGYPACVYVTTEHLSAGTEVFNVVLSYLVRRSAKKSFTLAGVHPLVDGTYHIPDQPDELIVALIIAAEQAFPLTQRQEALRPIARALGLDLGEVLYKDRFRLLTDTEIRALFHHGVDVQLHTHTHRLPEDAESVAAEIKQNRAAVTKITEHVPRHFCYPSGEYSHRHLEWLRGLGIVSATTCDPGLNGFSSSVLLLKRFLDSDSFTDISFEAEVCGVREIARAIRKLARQFLPRSLNPTAS
jgi:peptidoglycan/xylan/chitin deacetylase (PgdA/CDA1 family)